MKCDKAHMSERKRNGRSYELGRKAIIQMCLKNESNNFHISECDRRFI